MMVTRMQSEQRLPGSAGHGPEPDAPREKGNHSGSLGSEFNRRHFGIAKAGFGLFKFTDEGDS